MGYRSSLLSLAVVCAACGGGGSVTPAPDGGDASDAHNLRSRDAGAADASEEAEADAPPEPPEGGDTGTDVDALLTRCNPGADFGTPVRVAGLESDFERGGPRLTADELTIYFSERPGTHSGLYVAQRPSLTAPFGTPVPLTTLNGSFDNFDPTTLNQLTLYFSSGSPAGMATSSNAKDIFVASRASTSAAFGSPTDLASPINTTSDDAQPFLRADGMELWFVSNRVNKKWWDIYRAQITGGVVGTPQVVTEISAGTSTDWVPTLSADGLTLFFSSDRGDAYQHVHVWTASRAHLADPFSNLHPVAAVNSASAQWDVAGWLSGDGCRFYMSSTRPLADGGAQLEQIYIATRGG